MIWDNNVFDTAFDAAGLREEIEVLSGPQAGHKFRARFECPQKLILDGQAHSTDYSIEYTTSDARSIAYQTLLRVGEQNFRVRDEPSTLGDGHWSVALLERWK